MALVVGCRRLPTVAPVGNWLSSWLWPAPPPDDPSVVMARALDELRRSHRVLEARAADKRRRIREADMRLVELGLRMQAHGNRLSAPDAQTFRRVSRHRKHLLASHGQFQSMLANVEGQIVSLEDAPALEQSFGSLAGSVDVRARRAADTQSMLETMRADMETLLTVQPRQRDIDAALNVNELESELDSMMHSSELADALDRVQRQLAEAPSPPTVEPMAATMDAEAALGLEPALLAR